MLVIASGRTVALMENEGDVQRDWVERLLAHFRIPQSELAKRAGLAPSTLSKFLARVRPGHTLDTRTIAALGKATGYVFPDAPDASAPREFAEGDAEPFRSEGAEDDAVAAARALCRGRNGRDPWIMRSRALTEIGVLPGDILVVDLNETPREGDIVCAQSYRPSGAAETVFRLFRPPFFLVGAGPGARLPLLADNRNAQIRGVVIGTFRPRGIAAAVA